MQRKTLIPISAAALAAAFAGAARGVHEGPGDRGRPHHRPLHPRRLARERHVADLIPGGSEGLIQATVGSYDVTIAGRMLLRLDELAVVKTLRGARTRTPILLLTAMDGVDDRIEGPHAGAADCLPKSFAFGPRRHPRPAPGDERRAHRAARPRPRDGPPRPPGHAGRAGVDLLPREFALLEHLLRRKGRVQTRTMLHEAM